MHLRPAAPVLAALLAAAPAPADPPRPGDLVVRVRVDDAPVLPSADDDPRDALVPVTFLCTRAPGRSFATSLAVGTPDGDRLAPVDLRLSRTREVVVDLPVADGTASFPVRAFAGPTRLMEMDLRIDRVPAWWVAGPYEGGPGELHDIELDAETDLPAMTGDQPGRSRGGTPWTLLDPALQGPDGVVDLLPLAAGASRRTVVAATRFRAAREGRARLLLGSDDSVRARWNGKPVHEWKGIRGCRPGEDAVEVPLRRGVNTLALKVCQEGGAFAFAASLDDGAGNPVPGLRSLGRARILGPEDGRPRLVDADRESATFEWRTRDPIPSLVVLRKAVPGRARPLPPEEPKERMVPADPGGEALVVSEPLPRTRHRLRVGGLPPGTRWLAEPAGDGGSPAGVLSFRTLAPEGVSQILRLRVAVVLFTNAVPERDAGRPGAREGVPEEEVARAARACEDAAAFLFRNSGMRLWMDNEFLEDRSFRAVPEGAHYGVGLQPGGGHEEALLALLAARGETPADYDAVAWVTLQREWDGTRWIRPFSGGGTYGPEGRFGIGNSSWKGGHDSGWLYVHEVGHQVDALYDRSGAPDYLFNHFQPWDGTAHRHGDHFDGNAWLLRWWGGVLGEGERGGASGGGGTPGFRWFQSRWGETVEVADGDGDLVPDDDPRLPLDERRLGSDPRRRDSDGDGLDDLREALATRGLEQGLQEVWAGPAEAHRCDPRRRDSDGDGVEDGADPEPTAAAPAAAARAAPEIDGRLAEGEWPSFLRLDEPECRGTLHLAAGEGRILLAGRMETAVDEIQVRIDADDDGWYVGRDNLHLVITPVPGGGGAEWRVLGGEGGGGALRVALHDCGVPGKWPFYDPEPPAAEGFAFASSREGDAFTFEAAVRRDPALGVGAEPGERMGIHLLVRPAGGVRRPGFEGAYTPFEPHAFFRFRIE